MANWNARIIEEFHRNDGKVGGYFQGAPMLLLHTQGRRTGREHVTPVVYLPDGDRFVVFGSKGGAPSDPDWVKNLEANEAVIEVGTQTIPVKATVLREGKERDELYAREVALRPAFGEYEKKTNGIRTIPVVILERVER